MSALLWHTQLGRCQPLCLAEALLTAGARAEFFVALRQVFSQEALTFQDKIVARAGLGDETYLPEGVLFAMTNAHGPCLHQHAQNTRCHAPFCMFLVCTSACAPHPPSRKPSLTGMCTLTCLQVA